MPNELETLLRRRRLGINPDIDIEALRRVDVEAAPNQIAQSVQPEFPQSVRLAQILAMAPRREDYRPGKGRQILGALLGMIAGTGEGATVGSRVRTGITEGPYERKLAEFESILKPQAKATEEERASVVAGAHTAAEKARMRSEEAQAEEARYRMKKPIEVHREGRLYGPEEKRIIVESEPHERVQRPRNFQRDDIRIKGETDPVRVNFDPESGEYFYPSGKPIDPSSIIGKAQEDREPSSPFAAIRATMEKESGQKLTSEQMVKLNRELQLAQSTGTFGYLTNDKGQVIAAWNPSSNRVIPSPIPEARRTGVPATEEKRRDVLTSMIQDVDELAALGEQNKGKIGAIAGRYQGLKRYTVGVSNSLNDTFWLSENLADRLLRERSGQAAFDREYRRLAALVPHPRQPYPMFKSGIVRLRADMVKLLEATGRDVPGATGGEADFDFDPRTGKFVSRKK